MIGYHWPTYQAKLQIYKYLDASEADGGPSTGTWALYAHGVELRSHTRFELYCKHGNWKVNAVMTVGCCVYMYVQWVPRRGI